MVDVGFRESDKLADESGREPSAAPELSTSTTPPRPSPSRALASGYLGAIQIAEVVAPTGTSWRIPESPNRSTPRAYLIDVIARGQVTAVRDKQEAQLTAGDLTFIDPSVPIRYSHTEVQLVSLRIPRELLGIEAADARRVAGKRIPGDRGVGAVVSSFVRTLPRYLDDYRPAEAARLGTTLVDLLKTLVERFAEADVAEEPANRQEELLARIHAFIEHRLADPKLTPGFIAGSHYISLRYLHKLFESQNVTVAGWIRQRRLERCRRDLLDPALQSKSVSAIAAQWGFGSAVHFSRAFRAAYGVPPSEYRQRFAESRNGAEKTESAETEDAPAHGAEENGAAH
ncbi:MAG TPA: helix-turn-helix domain-containing protein [Actinopolymorphaceae bacterium]|jgi:AraC-like DNA-binding protein